MARHRPRYPAPVRAILVDGERHALDHASDPRVVRDADAPPDLVIVNATRLGGAKFKPPALDPELRRRIAEGRSTLVLDASGEGPSFSKRLAQSIHYLLRDLDLPASRVAYLTQNRDFQASYLGWCGGGIPPVTVVEHDYYLSRFFHGHAETGRQTFAERLAQFEARAAERERRFVCLNFSPRTAKVLLLLAMLRDGLGNEGFISFPGFDRAAHPRAVSKSALAHDLVNLPGLEAEAAALLPWLDALDARGPAMLGMPSAGPGHMKAPLHDAGLDEYGRAWFTVITETEVMGTRRITEKPFKALANFSPLILWGNAGSLALLRGFDFQTFGGFIDEAYDDEPDPRRRFAMVRGEIRRLCALPQGTLRQGERDLADTLAHNADRALIHMPRIYRDNYEPKLIDRLLDLSPVRAKA